MGTEYFGPDETDDLLTDIEVCLKAWGDDPAYGAAAQKLREVCRELDVLSMSPGKLAAARAAADNQSGQRQHESQRDY